MGKSLNKCQLIGHLGQDPEVRYGASGNAVVNISVATSDTYKGEEQTEWHRVVAFGKLGELCGQYLKKGSQVYFDGKIQTRSWEKDGVTRYSTEVVANEMIMLDSKGQAPRDYGAVEPEKEPVDDTFDDLPF